MMRRIGSSSVVVIWMSPAVPTTLLMVSTEQKSRKKNDLGVNVFSNVCDSTVILAVPVVTMSVSVRLVGVGEEVVAVATVVTRFIK